MKEFNISPIEWEKLHRWDILVLGYYSILENYYEKDALDKMQKKERKKQEVEANKKKIESKLPKVATSGRGKHG